MTDLHRLTDDELEQARLRAEAAMIKARNEEAECRFHQMLRRHVKEQSLRDRIKELQAEIEDIKGVPAYHR